MGEKAVNSVLLLFVLLMAQIWVAVLLIAPGLPGVVQGGLCPQGPQPHGAEGVGPNWQACCPKNKQRQLVPIPAPHFLVSCSPGTPGSVVLSVHLGQVLLSTPPRPEEGGVTGCLGHKPPAGFSPGLWLGQDEPWAKPGSVWSGVSSRTGAQCWQGRASGPLVVFPASVRRPQGQGTEAL